MNSSFSKIVNTFIESLKQHSYTIKVVKISNDETIIFYEQQEHEPIINYNAKYSLRKNR